MYTLLSLVLIGTVEALSPSPYLYLLFLHLHHYIILYYYNNNSAININIIITIYGIINVHISSHNLSNNHSPYTHMILLSY